MVPPMMRLEEFTPGAQVAGLLPDRTVTVVQVQWHGTTAVTLTFRDEQGRVDQELLYRTNEEQLSLVEAGRTWSFDAPGDLFRLASEALRIRYVRQPFSGSDEVLFGVTSLNVDWPDMFARGAEPS